MTEDEITSLMTRYETYVLADAEVGIAESAEALSKVRAEVRVAMAPEPLPYAVVQATSDYVISRHRYANDALESARSSSEVRRVINADGEEIQ